MNLESKKNTRRQSFSCDKHIVNITHYNFHRRLIISFKIELTLFFNYNVYYYTFSRRI